MNTRSPKYTPGQVVSVYGNLYIIMTEGVLDGGEYWYRGREICIDHMERLVLFTDNRNFPEDDILLTEKVVPNNYRQSYHTGDI